MVNQTKELLMAQRRLRFTARQLLCSKLVGHWEDRNEVKDRAVYAREFREQAQYRLRPSLSLITTSK